MRSKVLNSSCIQQSFSKKGGMQTSTEVVFGKDMSRWRLPKSSKCFCTTVSGQNLSSPYTTEEVIEGGVIISKKPLLLIILGPSDSQSLKACEPTNQRINFSLLRCIKKVVASHTLHLPDSHSPFLHPWWRCLWKTSLTFPKASLNLVVFCGWFEPTTPAPWPKGQRVKGCPQRNDVEKDNAKLAILVEMEISYL